MIGLLCSDAVCRVSCQGRIKEDGLIGMGKSAVKETERDLLEECESLKRLVRAATDR